MEDYRFYKDIMWAASKLAFNITNGRLPKDYKTRTDYISHGKAVNRYQKADFIGDVYCYTHGIGNIHAGLIGVSKVGIILSFRGTDGDDTRIGSLLDWMNNFLDIQVPFAPYGIGKVHMGFFSAVNGLMEEMVYKTMDLLIEAKKTIPNPIIYITGHSKGGAMAAIMAKILQKFFQDKIIVYSFGAPRVGDLEFRMAYDITHYRYESFLDIICHLPLTSQEIQLLQRMGILHKTLVSLLSFEPYYPVGTGICIYKPKGIYGRYPYDTHNALEEKLNSFYAIEQMLWGGDLQMFVDAHDKDYYD